MYTLLSGVRTPSPLVPDHDDLWLSGSNNAPLGYAGGQWNLTAYCDNDPVNNTDPSGLLIGFEDHAAAEAFIKELKDLGAKNIAVNKLPFKKDTMTIQITVSPEDKDSLFKYAEKHFPIPEMTGTSCYLYNKYYRPKNDQEKEKVEIYKDIIERRNRFLIAAGIAGISEEIYEINGNQNEKLTYYPKQVNQIIKDNEQFNKIPLIIDVGGEQGNHNAINVNVITKGSGDNAGKLIPRLILRDGPCDGELPFKDNSVDKLIDEGSPLPNANEVKRLMKKDGVIFISDAGGYDRANKLIDGLKKLGSKVSSKQTTSTRTLSNGTVTMYDTTITMQ